MNKYISVIDVGTNNILLLIAEIDRNNNVNPISRKSSVSALGKDMTDDLLTAEGIDRARVILKNYIKEAQQYNSEIYILGTSCSREAKNINEISEWLKNHYSIDYKIISGEEEADLNGLANADDFPGNLILFDIGGGSTEFTFVENKKIIDRHSINLGIRRLINTSSDKHWQHKEIQRILSSVPIVNNSQFNLVGIGGTVTSIAAMELNQESYSGDKIHGFQVSKEKLVKLHKEISTLSEEKIKELLPFEPERSDILETGLLIVKEILEYFAASEFIVSDKGIQFGFLKKIIDNGLKYR